ncbi:MAG TPA: hypothetical protein VKO18_07670, partial [Terriglobia bacterium]|nr:hypothetical protein [Terriglobia bacterium]
RAPPCGMADLPPIHGILAMMDHLGPMKISRLLWLHATFCRARVKRSSPLFSSTSWREWCKSFVFINIMESRKTDIFSIFVFINLGNLSLNFNSPFFSMTLAAEDWISNLFSIR